MVRKAVIALLTLGAIGTLLASVTSYRLGAYVYSRFDPGTSLDVELSRGWMCIEVLTSRDPKVLDAWEPVSGFYEVESLRGYAVAWYRDPIWGAGGPIPGTSQTRQCVSLHLLTILFASYPAVVFIRGPVRRWHRRRKGRCVKCGYELTGLPEPRCPECGTRIKGGTGEA